MKKTLKILRIILQVVAGLFVTYAVAFSVVATVALYVLFVNVYRPIAEVKRLATVNPAETAYMRDYRLRTGMDKNGDSLYQVFVPFDSISPVLKQTVIAAEDDGFYTHPGFDIEAMLSAMEYNRAQNKIKRGASTITQQLAKNLFLSNERSFERKYKELAYTVLLEMYLGKDRIFELYLNYAQWGKNIFGCEAASQTYYKKSSRKLTLGESMRLASILAMPLKLSPHNGESAYMGKRMAVIANNMYLHGRLTDSAYEAITGNPPPRKDSTQAADSADRN